MLLEKFERKNGRVKSFVIDLNVTECWKQESGVWAFGLVEALH